MTGPAPRTKLDDTRDALHAALVRTLAAAGWGPERAHRMPPRQPVAPCGWVDAFTLSQGHTEEVPMTAATVPVVLLVDGASPDQVARLDVLMAHGWVELTAAATKPFGPAILTAGPDTIDLGGAETRAVVFQVQVPLMVRTLCHSTLTPSDGAPSPDVP